MQLGTPPLVHEAAEFPFKLQKSTLFWHKQHPEEVVDDVEPLDEDVDEVVVPPDVVVPDVLPELLAKHIGA